jgi:hypothetical protein
MIINYKKNGNFSIEFNNLFKTVDDLKVFINEKDQRINVDGLEEVICKVYDELVVLDCTVKFSVLYSFIHQRFSFKYRRPNNINFWLERGYGINEFNKFVGKNINELVDGVENNFKFNKFKFKYNGTPKCNLCSDNLILEPCIGRYNIVGCENDNCETYNHQNLNTIKQLAFIPLEIYLNKNKRKNVNSKITVEYWLLNGYSYSEAVIKTNEIKKALSDIKRNSVEHYKLTTDMDEVEIINSFKRNSPFCVDYWLDKGLTILDSKGKITELQTSNVNKFNELKRNNPNLYADIFETKIEYWLKKGYSVEESKIKLSERQSTFSLEKCTQKYGDEEGKTRFTERQNKWLNSLLNNDNMVIGYSKISQELFYKLLESYDIDDRQNVHFATHNKEYKLEKDEGGVWLYDFTDLKQNKIIEFHGDMYHGNPKQYKSNDYPNVFKKTITAQEIWDKDKRKLELARSKGFEVLIIWDSEYRWGNKQSIIDKCVDFLNKKDVSLSLI